MKQRNHFKKGFGKKVCAIVTTGAFVTALGIPQIGGLGQALAESMSVEGYVTAAASRAAQPAPEILGLSGVEETGASTGSAAYGVQEWNNPKYYIMGDTTYNTSANPYMVNAVSVTNKTDPNASPVIAQNTSREGGGRGPMGSLAAYGVDATDDAVWDLLPDVVIGVGGSNGNVDYTSEEYAGAISTAKGVEYSPIGVEYYTATNENIIKEMYALAEAGDKVVADSNGKKHLRYGSALDIAKNLERYIIGTQGYILEAINNETVSKKTVAAVSSYDETAKTFTLLKSGVAEGTASSNKLLEACEQVSDNLIDKLGKETATADELAQADAIVIGGQSGGAGEALTDPDQIVAKMDASLVKKTYYTTNAIKGYPGSMYGVVMNSVENTQNIGRVLGFVYPEVIDQDDWICYYYDKFYHIKSDKLAEVIDKAMDGVRNYNATDAANYLTWTEADASTYNADAVQAKLQEGVSYLKACGTKVNTALQPSSYLASDATGKVDISKASITLEATSYTSDGTAKTPAISSVKLPFGITLDAADYSVSYNGNVNPGLASVTITGAGNFSGTIKETFEITGTSGSWTRLKGGTALSTMQAIVNNGWTSSEYAIVATNKGYQDALAATALAGLLDCPVLMTDPSSLSSQTKSLITSKGIKNVIIVGGTSAVSTSVETQLKAVATNVSRIAGGTAPTTARKVYNEGLKYGSWSSDAIVATVDSFQDALSIAPYAYAKKAPIFLTDLKKGTLGTATASLIKNGGFTRTLIVGGTSAVKDTVEAQVTSPTRLKGGTAYTTCKAVANFCIENGMGASYTGVATGKTYQDALCGAALCGKNNSILVLADDKNSTNVNAVIAKNKATLKGSYIFGGTAAVSDTVANAIAAASK